MIRVFIIDQNYQNKDKEDYTPSYICLNTDNNEDAERYLQNGAFELSKEYINETFKGNEKYASPSNTVVNTDGKTVIFNYTPPTLEELKQQKLDEVKIISDSFRDTNLNKNMYITSSLGFVADADKDSQDNAYSLSKILETQEPGATLHYRDRNNEDHELNKDQLYTLYLEMKTNGVNLFNQKWALEEKVNNGQTVEEIEAIEVTFKMLDFTSGVPTNFK